MELQRVVRVGDKRDAVFAEVLEERFVRLGERKRWLFWVGLWRLRCWLRGLGR
jgi:hypothetical protein